MNDLSTFPERLRVAFRPTDHGVVGLVDELLDLCGERGLRLDWSADKCRVRLLGVEQDDSTNLPLPHSVFRAILTRMATLCNERIPGSVSPYGGEGELSIRTNPPSIFRVAFANPPGEQWLEVRRLENDEGEGFTDPIANRRDLRSASPCRSEGMRPC
jgi:hypothetical protein